MNLDNNIHDAFEIVAKTYENVNKLMSFCRENADEKGEFILSSPKFLRWRSDIEVDSWLMKSFILLYQNSKDKIMKNKWRRGPIYLMEINLNPYLYIKPMINIAKYVYSDNLSSWGEGISSADHWRFYDPLYQDDFSEGDEYNYCNYISDEAYSNRYWGLKKIIGTGIPLTDINRENAYEKIFGGFRSLIDM